MSNETEYSETKGETQVETKKGAHALEKWFDIEEGTTEREKIKYTFPSSKSDRYDPKDREIEEQAHEVFQEAMSGYHSLDSLIENMEPKYRARMAEVALQFLKTALDAADRKGRQKESIEKIKLQKEKIDKTSTGDSKTQIFGVADRNKLLKQLREVDDQRNGVIDVTPDKEDKADREADNNDD